MSDEQVTKIKSLEEFECGFDIVSRMAIFAIAKSFQPEELEVLLDAIKESLEPTYGDKAEQYISSYRESVMRAREAFSVTEKE